MTRQSATQHLDILVRADLVTVVRRVRERLHYLNPAPIHEIEERWISGFDKPRLQAISAIKHQAEEYAKTNAPTPVPDYVYVTYIRATLCALAGGAALSDAALGTLVPARLLSNERTPGRSAHAAARHRHWTGGGRTARPHETAPRRLPDRAVAMR